MSHTKIFNKFFQFSVQASTGIEIRQGITLNETPSNMICELSVTNKKVVTVHFVSSEYQY